MTSISSVHSAGHAPAAGIAHVARAAPKAAASTHTPSVDNDGDHDHGAAEAASKVNVKA